MRFDEYLFGGFSYKKSVGFQLEWSTFLPPNKIECRIYVLDMVKAEMIGLNFEP